MSPKMLVTRAALLLAAVLLLFQGCAPTVRPEATWEKDASALVDHAESMFRKKQYDEAAKTVDGFFVTYPKSRYTDRALALAGELQIVSRNYPQALKYYKNLIEKYPSSSLIAEAKYKIGLCYFELKEYDLAIDNLEDRAGITEPQKLLRISEMLYAGYTAKGRTLPAVKELAYLAKNALSDTQRAGYRDRVREMIETKLTEDEIKSLSAGEGYPADLALLRYASLLITQHHPKDAIEACKDFLNRFPAHPEQKRAEMLLADATAKQTAPRFSLGVLIPQTGPASFFGERVLKGIQLAVHLYNEKHPDATAEILVKDTEGSADKAVAGLADLASKGVVAVVGPLLTKEVEALAPSLAKLQIPVITPTATGPGVTDLSPWIFRNALTNDAQATAAARYALGLKLKKFVIFAPDDPYGRDLSRVFIRELGTNAEILANITYPPDTNDFGPYLRKLIEIDLRSQKIPIPDDEQERKRLFQVYTPTFEAMYLPGYADKIGLLLPQLAFYNITGRPLIGSNNWHTPDLLERAGQYAEGAVFVDGFYPESIDASIKSVVDAYRAANQEDPDILAAQAYDAAAMVLSLLSEKTDTPQAVKDGLLGLRDYPGISGMTSFPKNGEADKKLFFIKIDHGRFSLLPQ